MRTSAECEHARIDVMAARDGERRSSSESASSHVGGCEACQGWLKQMEAVDGLLRTSTYPPARIDMWATVETRIRDNGQASLLERMWPACVALLGWRVLQLVVDLPMPWLQWAVPVLGLTYVGWRFGGSVIAIEASAPELQKRGV